MSYELRLRFKVISQAGRTVDHMHIHGELLHLNTESLPKVVIPLELLLYYNYKLLCILLEFGVKTHHIGVHDCVKKYACFDIFLYK